MKHIKKGYKKSIFLTVCILMFMVSGHAQATVIDFDNINIPPNISILLPTPEYQGFNWQETNPNQPGMVFISEQLYNDGQGNTADFPSGTNAVALDTVTITRIDNGVFDFLGAQVSGYSVNDQVARFGATGLTINTYLKGTLKDNYTIDLQAKYFGDNGQFMDSYSIDKLVIAGSGSDDPSGNIWLMDNFEYYVEPSSDPVPEPSTLLLFGAGIAGLAALGRRNKQ